MDERINSKHFNLDLKGIHYLIIPGRGEGWWILAGESNGFYGERRGARLYSYTEYKGGTVEN